MHGGNAVWTSQTRSLAPCCSDVLLVQTNTKVSNFGLLFFIFCGTFALMVALNTVSLVYATWCANCPKNSWSCLHLPLCTCGQNFRLIKKLLTKKLWSTTAVAAHFYRVIVYTRSSSACVLYVISERTCNVVQGMGEPQTRFIFLLHPPMFNKGTILSDYVWSWSPWPVWKFCLFPPPIPTGRVNTGQDSGWVPRSWTRQFPSQEKMATCWFISWSFFRVELWRCFGLSFSHNVKRH